jgi:DNA-binding MarR family transcriptional regulator
MIKTDVPVEDHNTLTEKISLQEPGEFTIDYFLKTGWQTFVNKYNQIASQFEITQAMGYVLINIRKEGTSVSQIANLMGVKTTSLSRILNNLEDLKLIYRQDSTKDKRSVNVFLTPLGVEKRTIAKQVVLDLNKFVDDHLTVSERDNLIQVLKRINMIVPEYQPGHPYIKDCHE